MFTALGPHPAEMISGFAESVPVVVVVVGSFWMVSLSSVRGFTGTEDPVVLPVEGICMTGSFWGEFYPLPQELE
jgi:hypothetical protein